ncbi:hypothetical protein VNI00_018218 [Paramarasmius palmivorus]|uniref:F-box domain-containing protein n=1 Tax=Paramarasmius palmivorus TaxID=297713 RepID=A0AAW0AYQ2_9AGAR
MEGTVAVQLPQEVLDTILNKLHLEDDVQTLKQCALTARCLVQTAQRILFYEVWLDEGSLRHNPHFFLILVEDSPHLAKYVTELGLCIISPQWGNEYPLAYLLSRLQSLKRVLLRTYPDVAPLPISTLPGGTAIRSFTLIDASVTFAMFNWLAAHSGLQDLHFIRVRALDSDATLPSMASQAVSSYAPVQLRRFKIDMCALETTEALLQWATESGSPMRFDTLRELTVSHLTQQSFVYLLRILDMAKDSLSCLQLVGNIPRLSSIRFSTYRNLRRIIYGNSLNSPSKTMLKAWCIALKESREIKLESFVISLLHGLEGGWLQYHDYPWKELEDALISGGRCARLVLYIVHANSIGTNADTIRELFPQLHASDACDLVVQNPDRFYSESGLYWEYTPRSGERMVVQPFDDLFY